MKATKLILALSSAAILLGACSKARDNNPGVEYAPDMYVSKGYEPFSQVEGQERTITTRDGETIVINKDGKTMREPVKGTIARGHLAYVYPYPNTADGYEAAKAGLKSPLTDSSLTAKYLEDGKYLYTINCQICHGEAGLGDGPLPSKGKYPKPPSYKSDQIASLPEGGMYHSITYGKNLMGPYGTVLSPEDRWKVIKYVQFLRNQQ